MAKISDEKKNLYTGLFQKLQLVSDYAMYVKTELIDGGVLGEQTSREKTAYGLYLRAVCLLTTLRKCANVKDFQTIVHSQRLLLEILVDLTLLHHSKDKDIAEKIKAWEDSRRLLDAQRIVEYYKNKPPKSYQAQQIFIKNEKKRICELRKKYGWTKHPARWSGPNNTFLDDISRAKELEHFEDIDIEEIYVAEHPRMNWMIHGSGLTGIRYLEEEHFYSLFGLSAGQCHELGLEIIRMILKGFGFFKGEYGKIWAENKKKIVMHMAPFLSDSSE